MDDIARSAKQLGTVIRKARRVKGMNQSQLGEMTGLRQATISKIENGEGATRIDTICDVLAALDLEFAVRLRTKAEPLDIEDIF